MLLLDRSRRFAPSNLEPGQHPLELADLGTSHQAQVPFLVGVSGQAQVAGPVPPLLARDIMDMPRPDGFDVRLPSLAERDQSLVGERINGAARMPSLQEWEQHLKDADKDE